MTKTLMTVVVGGVLAMGGWIGVGNAGAQDTGLKAQDRWALEKKANRMEGTTDHAARSPFIEWEDASGTGYERVMIVANCWDLGEGNMRMENVWLTVSYVLTLNKDTIVQKRPGKDEARTADALTVIRIQWDDDPTTVRESTLLVGERGLVSTPGWPAGFESARFTRLAKLKGFIEELQQRKLLRVEFTFTNGTKRTALFDLTGSRKALQPVLDECADAFNLDLPETE